MGSPLGYTGQFTDPTTGLVDLRARQYDPAIGRFLSPDPLGPLGVGSYAYVGDNPLAYVDPSGLHRGPSCGWNLLCHLGHATVACVSNVYCNAGFVVLSLATDTEGDLPIAEGAVDAGETELPDAYVVVRGGTKPLPGPGQPFPGATGPTREDAASGVPHGTIRSTTAGAIREGGGTVEFKPEPTRSGVINEKHVDICLGQGSCPFGEPFHNPVPRSGRVR